jgi:hypothetical protein
VEIIDASQFAAFVVGYNSHYWRAALNSLTVNFMFVS